MRKTKIVADSSADVLSLAKIGFAAAPLKIITSEREFVDDSALDVENMVNWFGSYKGKSKTSCPNPADWLEAFGDAEEVFCITITSGLSGSYNAACIAKQMYEEADDGKRAGVIDSLSAGPELMLLIEKLEEYIEMGLTYEEICVKIISSKPVWCSCWNLLKTLRQTEEFPRLWQRSQGSWGFGSLAEPVIREHLSQSVNAVGKRRRCLPFCTI